MTSTASCFTTPVRKTKKARAGSNAYPSSSTVTVCSTEAPDSMCSLNSSPSYSPVIEKEKLAPLSFASPSSGTTLWNIQSPRGAPSPRTPPPVSRRSRSPPGAPRRRPEAPLLHALNSRSLEEVRTVLDQDPMAARLPFFDHGVEPPLCCAVRIGLPVATVQLLLDNGADVSQEDVHGRTPLAILTSLPLRSGPGRWGEEPTVQLRFGDDAFDTELASPDLPTARLNDPSMMQLIGRNVEIADALLAAGADPSCIDAQGLRPLDLARSAGNLHLEELLAALELEDRDGAYRPFGGDVAWPAFFLRLPPPLPSPAALAGLVNAMESHSEEGHSLVL